MTNEKMYKPMKAKNAFDDALDAAKKAGRISKHGQNESMPSTRMKDQNKRGKGYAPKER